MQPHIQLNMQVKDDDPVGDCYRTAIACLLEVPPSEVPHIFDYSRSEVSWEKYMSALSIMRKYLLENHDAGIFSFQSHGSFSLDKVLEWMAVLNPDSYWILSGATSLTDNHSVVCKGGKIVHNPGTESNDNLQNSLLGPCVPGDCWEITVITKSLGEG